MSKKIINIVFTLLLIKIFVTSVLDIWLVFFLIFLFGDWLVALWLTDNFNYEREQNGPL